MKTGYRALRRVVLTVVGVAVTALGVFLLPAPGPGALVILAGLYVLSLEYAWARRRLDAMRDGVLRATYAATESVAKTVGTLVFAAALLAGGVYLVVAEPRLPLGVNASAVGYGIAVGGALTAAVTLGVLVKARRRSAAGAGVDRRETLREAADAS